MNVKWNAIPTNQCLQKASSLPWLIRPRHLVSRMYIWIVFFAFYISRCCRWMFAAYLSISYYVWGAEGAKGSKLHFVRAHTSLETVEKLLSYNFAAMVGRMINICPQKIIFEERNKVTIVSDPAGRGSAIKETFYIVLGDGENDGSPTDVPRSPHLTNDPSFHGSQKRPSGRAVFDSS